MVTFSAQVAVPPEASVAVQITLVVPRENTAPAARPSPRTMVTVSWLQLSVAVGACSGTAALHMPAAAGTAIAAVHDVNAGFCMSMTVSV
jgi:hypothetical protein